MLRKEFLPFWRSRDVAEIGKKDVVAILDGMLARGSPSSANHAFSYINHFFNWSISRGLIDVSPCQGVFMPAAKVSQERVLTDQELEIVCQRAVETP